MYALAQKKRVVPVLLDDTTLSPELAPESVASIFKTWSITRPPGGTARYQNGCDERLRASRAEGKQDSGLFGV